MIMFIADCCVHMALRCLVLLLAPMKTKKLESSSVPYVLNVPVMICQCTLWFFCALNHMQSCCCHY